MSRPASRAGNTSPTRAEMLVAGAEQRIEAAILRGRTSTYWGESKSHIVQRLSGRRASAKVKDTERVSRPIEH
jgi:hypothetical protein